MIDLHEVLSEFSFGYGVTRELEDRFLNAGLRATPFFPNLRHEADLGFDMSLRLPGKVIMLQFKLGKSIDRFRRSSMCSLAPPLSRPFFRVIIDTSSRQYRNLRQLEDSQRTVYYISPKFNSWRSYEKFYLKEEVLNHSLTFKPSKLDNARHQSDGRHWVLFDQEFRYVCTEPQPFDEVNWEDEVKKISKEIKEAELPTLDEQLQSILDNEEGTNALLRMPAIHPPLQDVESLSGLRSIVSIVQAASIGISMLFVTENIET